eukprot:NODE_308_length_1682_cov_751.038722.p1 GENE.NODE_308_length_1682_cov_751.038722~~NODE_308_length_1682_cov_751.038722.p1  ORF type:complete len:486 (-),score=197.53 NODE_308_length_1682_cov_751.038722:225-1574(-)
MAPPSLVHKFDSTKGRVDGSTATFGAPFYGERLLGRLVYGESLHNHAHCKEDDYVVPPPDEIPVGTYSEVRLIHIVLVRRGLCSFVTKVRVGKLKGAHAVIIVDSEDSVLTQADIASTIVSDDGYGDAIDIPSMLISKTDGAPLIAAATSEQVIIELAWDVPTNHVVAMDLWMSSGSMDSMRFLSDFAPKRRALGHSVSFVPHYHIFAMASTRDYNDLCTDVSAQFCAEDPDGPGPVTGAMVIAEDMRQLCIHEITKVARTTETLDQGTHIVEYAEKFWHYVERIPDYCPLKAEDPTKRFGAECSNRLMASVGIPQKKIQQCIMESTEQKLSNERENTAWSPHALRINGWRYSGTLDAELVTRAICAGFVKQPDICKHITEPVNPFKDERPQGISVGSFVLAVVIVSLITLIAMFLYKRSLTKHMHSTLREEVMLEVQHQFDTTYRQMQ